MREQAPARAEFNDVDPARRAESTPHFFELAGQKASKDGVDVAGGVEIARFAELLRFARIVAEFGIVEAEFVLARTEVQVVGPDQGKAVDDDDEGFVGRIALALNVGVRRIPPALQPGS